MTRVIVSAALAIALSLPAAAVRADEQTPRERAIQLVRDGAKRFEEGDKHGAIRAFEQAYQVYPAPEILYNLGKAYQRINEAARAYVLLRRFLAEGTMVSADRRAEAVEALRNLEPYVGKLRVSTKGAKPATIRVDGKVVGTTPLREEVIVQPGAHVVVALVAGKQWARVQVGVSGGNVENVVLQPPQVPSPKDAAARTGGTGITYTPAPEPVYKRWWFWTAAVAVASTTAVIMLSRGNSGSGPTNLGRFPFTDF